MHDLAIILVSYHNSSWLRACLKSVLDHVDGCAVDVVVVNNANDGTEHVVREFPSVRLIRCENRGFAHANNRGLETCDARYVLFLNVDTEVLDGTFRQLVEALDRRPEVGLAGVRQVGVDGRVAPSMRRFPSAARTLFEALGSERFPFRSSWTGERDLDSSHYRAERVCDWTSGSFLVARREVLEEVGPMDERFFLYSEEPDLCLRASKEGWEVRHIPVMTILHHGGDVVATPELSAQDAFSRLQFARKHFSFAHRMIYAGALGLGYSLRAISPGRARAQNRTAARSALRTLVGIDRPPFGQTWDLLDKRRLLFHEP
jgi:GT2 family glycosyltransferase